MNIAEVAKKYDLTTDTLRYYEKVGLIPPISRTSGGIRNYTEQEQGWVEFVKCMRDAGMSVDTLARYLKLCQKGDETLEERKQLLLDERSAIEKRLSGIQETLRRINYKIDNYEKMIECEKKLLNN